MTETVELPPPNLLDFDPLSKNSSDVLVDTNNVLESDINSSKTDLINDTVPGSEENGIQNTSQGDGDANAAPLPESNGNQELTDDDSMILESLESRQNTDLAPQVTENLPPEVVPIPDEACPTSLPDLLSTDPAEGDNVAEQNLQLQPEIIPHSSTNDVESAPVIANEPPQSCPEVDAAAPLQEPAQAVEQVPPKAKNVTEESKKSPTSKEPIRLRKKTDEKTVPAVRKSTPVTASKPSASASTPRTPRTSRPTSAVSQSSTAPVRSAAASRRPISSGTNSKSVDAGKPSTTARKTNSTVVNKTPSATPRTPRPRPTSVNALSSGASRPHSNTTPRGEPIKPKVGSLENKDYKPSGGEEKIFSEKVKVNAESKVSSKANIDHTPGGGNKKIFSEKVDYTSKTASKVGSMEKKDYKPGGGDKKIFSETPTWKTTSKVGSLENAHHVPAGGNKKVYD